MWRGEVPLEGVVMGRKENPLVSYCQNNQNFAELMDGWLFHGEGSITAEQIKDQDRRFLVRSARSDTGISIRRWKELHSIC